MADNPNKRNEPVDLSDGHQKTGGQTGQTAAVWSRPGRTALTIMLACSLLANGAILLVSYLRTDESALPIPPEISLGEFQYRANSPGQRGITGTDFSLHIALLNDVRSEMHDRVAARRHRIRQAVEEVLRRAHGTDFEDPVLGDVKRQIQERINAVLEMRAISEVIVTDLVVQSEGAQAGSILSAPDSAIPEPPARHAPLADAAL